MQEGAYYLFWLGFVAILAWLMFGLPIWIVLGCMSIYENRRSRLWPQGDADEDDGVPQVCSFARPAKVVAFSVIGVICLWFALSTGPWSWFAGQPIMGTLFVVMALLEAALPLLLLALVVCFVAVLVQMRRRHRVAGKDTAVAYGVIVTLHATTLAAALAFGFFGHSWSLL
jgi:hypothetical protein